MSYIFNSINNVSNLSNRAFKESERLGDNDKIRLLIFDVCTELSNIKNALKIKEVFDKRLHTLDIIKHGKLLDLLYEPENNIS